MATIGQRQSVSRAMAVRSGFTLIELAVSFGLATVLALIAIYLVQGAGNSLKSGVAAGVIDDRHR